MQKVLLGSLVILATLVTSCNAQCYVQLLEIPPGEEIVECKDSDGNTHPVNSTWEKDCVVCTCGRNEIGCCSKVATPVGFDESKCEPIFHPDNCTYSVVERENPGKDCVVNRYLCFSFLPLLQDMSSLLFLHIQCLPEIRKLVRNRLICAPQDLTQSNGELKAMALSRKKAA